MDIKRDADQDQEKQPNGDLPVFEASPQDGARGLNDQDEKQDPQNRIKPSGPAYDMELEKNHIPE
jgi:hypothetical protein